MSTRYGSHFMIQAILKHRWTTILLDSGAYGNYFSRQYAHERVIPLKNKAAPYSLTSVDGTSNSDNNGTVDQETYPLGLKTGNHWEEIKFDVTNIGQHAAILGIP